MYVGVILIIFVITIDNDRIPHVCGGDPISQVPKRHTALYSPCMWG